MTFSNQIETIDAYLRGDLTPAEVASFETQLEHDPTLSEELAFQKQVVSGLQEARKLELKSRLAQVDVTGAAVNQYGWAKLTGGLIIATILGFVAYEFWPNQSKQVSYIEIDGPVIEEVDLPEIDLNAAQSASERSQEITDVKLSAPPISTRNEKAVKEASTSETENLPEADQSMVFEPEIDLPDDDADVAGAEFEPEELPENFTADLETKDIDALNVEQFDDKSKSLRYRYFDGKLALYGDFRGLPYQILEINQNNGAKQVFLVHDEAYYRLKSANEEQSLIPITDQSVLNELIILQNKK